MQDWTNEIQAALADCLSGVDASPSQRVEVLRRLRGKEKTMKRSVKWRVALVAALCLALAGGAVAALQSQVAAFFGKQQGEQMAQWLENGRVAQLGDEMRLGDVSFTLEEVVLKDGGLYGVGTVTPRGRDALIPAEIAWENEYAAQEDWQRQLGKAQESGGRLLLATVELTRVGVDGGELLTPGTSGYYDELQPDGSLIFSIEGQDGIAISEGKRYTLELRADVRTWDGEEWRSEVTGTWTLSCVPETLQEAPIPKETAATAAQDAQYRVILPEEYRSTGSMGLYAAIPAELGSAMAPEWINQSGVKQRTAELVTFEDGSELELEDELIFYREMEGTWDYNTLKRREEDQKAEPMILGAPSMACAVGDLAGWCRFGFPDEEPVPTLEKTAVTGITLEEAQADFAALLARVGITDYQCVYALEMDLARIHSLGERMNASIEQGRMRTNGPIYDYDAATAEDEGYYLDYCAMGLEANANETIQMEATAYITAKGFAFVSIRAPYLRGGQVGVAPSLVPVEEIAGRLPVDAAGSRFDIRVERVIDATLTWAPLRAKAPETGMVFSPVWLLTYQQADGESRGWAEYDAVTGQIIEADFR